MGVAGYNRVMAFACIGCTIESDATKQLIRSDLIEQVGRCSQGYFFMNVNLR